MDLQRRKSIRLALFLVSLLAGCSPAAIPTPAAPTANSTISKPAPPASLEPTGPVSSNNYAITDVAVVDVENGTVVSGRTVLIQGDRIDQIGEPGEPDIRPGTEVIDGHGLYLMPGLVDAHVHYFDAPIFGRVMTATGVLLVRDMGMPNEYILKLRDELNQGKTLGPEMVATGAILDGAPPQIPQISMGIETPVQGRAAVRQQAEAGVDMIKVYSTLDKETFLAILDEAKKLGLKVVGHNPDSIYVEDAAGAGIASIEHGFGFDKAIGAMLGEPVSFTFEYWGADIGYFGRLDEVDLQVLQDFYQRLRATGVTLVPTVVVWKAFPDIDAFEARDVPHSEYISSDLLSSWKSQWSGQSMEEFVWRGWAQMVKQMNQAGIPLMIGTDLSVPGIIPGYSVHEEMAIWQEAGIPVTDILRSATIVPARFMGLGDRLGSISEGKTASMILLRADPLEDIGNAQEIEAVFLRGEYFTREELDQLLVEAKDLAQRGDR